MVDDKDAELQELRACLARLEAAPPASPPPPPASPAKNGCANVIGGLVVVGALLWLVSTCTGEGAGDLTTASTPSWTPPTGFVLEAGRGDSVATQWAEPTRAECRGSGGVCFALNAIAEKGCSRNLYVSVTLLDDNGQNIGWTNDTAQGVLPGERTRLVFTTYERAAKSARIAEVSCY